MHIHSETVDDVFQIGTNISVYFKENFWKIYNPGCDECKVRLQFHCEITSRFFGF